MSKIDFKKEWKHLYRPSAKDFEVVEVPPMNFLMIDGHGDPNVAQDYVHAIEALYAVAYKVKFLSKTATGKDYVVPPLEGLWWAEDMQSFTQARDKSKWEWTMMIMTPDWVKSTLLDQALEEVGAKKNPPGLDKMKSQKYDEGLCVQIMHVGSYDEEGPTLARMHQDWIPQNGFVENGKHHEIYLSDPRRVEPKKLKTVLRQPLRQV